MDQSLEQLFKSYLQVCNDALETNGNRFPFKQILGAAEAKRHREVEVCIVDDQPDVSYVIHLEHQKILGESMSCPSASCDCTKPKWNVTRSYLEDVINNPDEYIQNPAKIDWEWMFDQEAAE